MVYAFLRNFTARRKFSEEVPSLLVEVGKYAVAVNVYFVPPPSST